MGIWGNLEDWAGYEYTVRQLGERQEFVARLSESGLRSAPDSESRATGRLFPAPRLTEGTGEKVVADGFNAQLQPLLVGVLTQFKGFRVSGSSSPRLTNALRSAAATRLSTSCSPSRPRGS